MTLERNHNMDICPIMSHNGIGIHCKENCAWRRIIYSERGILDYGCAIREIARYAGTTA